ncbi:MAG: conserved rane protein of unknown function [Firmicutes bacterium]|nr:conserved rane protein of unknown function [Bacillota bacterium]
MTNSHPYVMAFLKFMIMATMGELLAVRIVIGEWKKTIGITYKAIVWRIIGMLVALMLQVFSIGGAGAEKVGLLYFGEGVTETLLRAFITSAITNLTFGPMFSGAHRIVDTSIDIRVEGGVAPSLSAIIGTVDWLAFIRFIVFKVQPFLGDSRAYNCFYVAA